MIARALAQQTPIILLDEPTSFLDNKFIYGTGMGLDFVTYYDKVLRLEYGINDMGETGLFIHFVAPI